MLQRSFLRVARAFVLGALAFALLGAAPATTKPAADQSFSQDELNALLAPIALYPDGLLSQVLMASTYPLEVVEAERFLKQNPALRGQALDDELATKNWDPSVQSLAAYPKVLITMSEKLEWTQRLGNAFLENQGHVMETVQELRRRAEATGNLKASAEQAVIHEKETIIIEPAQTEVVYVVEYDPAVVYGAWWYAAAYNYYDRYYGHYSYSASVSYTSYHISSNHWDWARADWHDRNLSIDGRENRFWNSAGRSQAATGAWEHDTAHRRGVEYPASAMRDHPRPGDTGPFRPGEANRGPAPSAAGSGAPTSAAANASPNGPFPNGPFQLPGAQQSPPLQTPDPARGLSQPAANQGLPNPPSMPNPSSMRGVGPPSFGAGGPPMLGGGGFPGGPPPGPPGPH